MRDYPKRKLTLFDMTGPRWTSIQSNGKTLGLFMGDVVHANSCGCQIIGRLLDVWFKQ